MRGTISFAAGAGVLLATVLVRVDAQGVPAGAAAVAQGAPARGAAPPAAGGRQGRGRGPATFPAQQRPPGDPALIARGKAMYDVNCRACHGADLRGGDMGGPNLLRSQVALNDQEGELIAPVLKGSLPLMPPVPLSDDDVKAVAAYVHSVHATMRGQGSPPAGGPVELDIVVGNAAAGQAYFQATCSGCHTAASLAGIATRVPEPMALQTYWVSGGGGGGRGGRGGRGGAVAGRTPAPVTATVTLPSGETYEGTLVRYDDFVIAINTANGTPRSFRRNGDVPRIQINDPRDAHRKLWPVLADTDMHNVTAYLVTLK
jgi:cytochrome c oxidase cbb3-type subunit 3